MSLFAATMNIEEAVLEFLKLVISWPVAVLIVVLVLRKQLMELLNGLIARLKDVSEASVGSATFKFVKTQIGEIHASAIPTKFGSNSHSFRSEPFGFEISYPIGPDWTEEQNDEFPQPIPGQIVAFALRAKVKDSRFQPNVNVLLQPFVLHKVAEYAAVTMQQLFLSGAKLTTYEVDSATNAASFSYVLPFIPDEKHPEEKVPLQCISRVIIPKDLGLAFLVTLTMQEGVDIPKKIGDNLVRTLNSFSVFKRATKRDSDETIE